MTNANPTFEAAAFIIPNKQDIVNDITDFHVRMWNNRLTTWGFPQIKSGDKVVQIWTTSEDVDSWNNHGAPDPILEIMGFHEGPRTYFPEYWPASVFAGLKEGETVTINGDKFNITLTTAQTKYRYKRFGTFEDVFDMMTR